MRTAFGVDWGAAVEAVELDDCWGREPLLRTCDCAVARRYCSGWPAGFERVERAEVLCERASLAACIPCGPGCGTLTFFTVSRSPLVGRVVTPEAFHRMLGSVFTPSPGPIPLSPLLRDPRLAV